MSVVPYVTVQPDYAEVFDDVATVRLPFETAWLSAYAVNAPQASIHAKVRLDAADDQGGVRVTVASGNIEVRRVAGAPLDLDIVAPPSSASTFTAPSHTSARSLQSSLHIPRTRIRLPRWRLATGIIGPLGITGFDIAESPERRYVAGGADGQLIVGALDGSATLSDEERARARVTLKGHVGDIRSARFFPSGEVILSTSSDMTARIFSALDGSNPRTLKGHKRAVLDSAILGRGREVLTCSADGTIRLWNVGNSKQIRVFPAEKYSAVNCLSIGSTTDSREGQDNEQDQGLVALGLSSGQVQLYDLRARTPAGLIAASPFPPGKPPAASDHWSQTPGKSITALDRLPSRNLLLAGTIDGVVSLHDLRMVTASEGVAQSSLGTNSWRRNGAAVTDLTFLDRSASTSPETQNFVASAADGLTYRADLSACLLPSISYSEETRSPILQEEYVGFDVESVHCVKLEASGRLILAGAGGAVKGY